MVIHPIPMKMSNSYLVCDQGIVLVDAGSQGDGEVVRHQLEVLGISPSQIRLIFLTHGHHDHIGALGELKQFLPCPVAIHTNEKEWVEKGLRPIPPGINLWGSIVKRMLETFVMSKLTFGGVPVDISLGNEPFSLEKYGVHGVIYHTPGHSSGSMSLILPSGEALVGDLAANIFFMGLKPGKVIFAEDSSLIPGSWQLLRDHGARMIYPGHGKPFEVRYLK